MIYVYIRFLAMVS